MIEAVRAGFEQLMSRGGIVMWPLLALSLAAVTLAVERAWFFLRTNAPGRLTRVDRLGRALRAGDRDQAARLAEQDDSVYGEVVSRLLSERRINDAAAADAIESQRRRLERFMPTLSTIITAAPMLGILGTVLGIISSFEILADGTTATDPRAVSQGIAEALITTAAGLTVAIVTLFPYNAFRAQIDRVLSRVESLASAALQGAGERPSTEAGQSPTVHR